MTINNPPDFDHIIEGNGELIAVQQFDIGAWNMDTDSAKDVAIDIDFKDNPIVMVNCVINDDSDSFIYGLPFTGGLDDDLNGYIRYITSTNVRLQRRTGGIFDAATFSNTGINRGIITIWYRE